MENVNRSNQESSLEDKDFDDFYAPQLGYRDMETLQAEAWDAFHARSDAEHAADHEEMIRVLAAWTAEEKSDVTH